jgi:hypothetical protein
MSSEFTILLSLCTVHSDQFSVMLFIKSSPRCRDAPDSDDETKWHETR